MRYIVLGERCNTRGNKFTRPADDVAGRAVRERHIYGDPIRYWEFTRRVGAFSDRQKKQLDRILQLKKEDEVTWMNLCLPHPTPGHWRLDEARTACNAFCRLVPPFMVVVCCGSRIIAPFVKLGLVEHPQHLGEVRYSQILKCCFTRLPHPSGRNLQWNSPQLIELCRARLCEGLLTAELELDRID